MNVVHADVGREPPQDGRKVEMRAAVERRFVQAPGLVLGPESVLELVLNVEPDPDRDREQRHRQMHEQERADADKSRQPEAGWRCWSPWCWPTRCEHSRMRFAGNKSEALEPRKPGSVRAFSNIAPAGVRSSRPSNPVSLNLTGGAENDATPNSPQPTVWFPPPIFTSSPGRRACRSPASTHFERRRHKVISCRRPRPKRGPPGFPSALCQRLAIPRGAGE